MLFITLYKAIVLNQLQCLQHLATTITKAGSAEEHLCSLGNQFGDVTEHLCQFPAQATSQDLAFDYLRLLDQSLCMHSHNHFKLAWTSKKEMRYFRESLFKNKAVVVSVIMSTYSSYLKLNRKYTLL